MSEAYQQKEWELDSLIDNLNSIEYTYEEYKKEVEHFIDRLLEDTKEINTLKKEIERLNNIINELEKYINENYIYDEVGMKIFDASTLQDKLQELKGEDKE